jgi:hypothetical protein
MLALHVCVLFCRYEEVLSQQEEEHGKEVMGLRAKLMAVQEEVALARSNSKSER